MCSTPRPKRQRIAAKAVVRGGALANMSLTARQSFASKANLADEKRQQLIVVKQYRQQTVKANKQRSNHRIATAKHTIQQPWYYWLMHASLTQIITKLLTHQINK